MSNYLYLIIAILLTAYGQLVFKWQIDKMGALPKEFFEITFRVIYLITNPWVMSAIIAIFILMLIWVIVLGKFDLTYAYPFYVGSTFALVMVFSILLFHESITVAKVTGMVLILLGLIVGSQR